MQSTAIVTKFGSNKEFSVILSPLLFVSKNLDMLWRRA